MVTEVIMPKLGQTMEEGKIERWLKKKGDIVEKGEILLEVTTDKATLEVEAYGSGMLRKIIVPEGQTVPVTTVIGYVAEEGEELPAATKEIPVQKETESPAQAIVKTETRTQYIVKPEAGAKIKASPLAKKIAAEKGIDLSKVEGTGPGGRITKEDVLTAAPSADKPAELSPMRKAIAEGMSKSKREIPHYYLINEIDMGEVSKKRENLSGISYTHIIIKAVAGALTEFPQLNASWQEGRIKTFDNIDIGTAVALEDGIITPVLRNVDKKTIQEISSEFNQLAEKAKGKKLTMEEYSGATFTISNLGMFGIESFLPIINPPQACILGIGAIKEKCAAISGKVEIRPVMKMVLSADHRVVDGITTAQFMKKLTDILENPDFM
jgi:pyruvate dehydrogenase E2 component (dihydrolipoamide acetyltransferase)